MEDILSLSISGVYSLLLLNISFSFLLAIRVRQLNSMFISSEEQIASSISDINERVMEFEDSFQ